MKTASHGDSSLRKTVCSMWKNNEFRRFQTLGRCVLKYAGHCSALMQIKILHELKASLSDVFRRRLIEVGRIC